jgi:hypothetical protein
MALTPLYRKSEKNCQYPVDIFYMTILYNFISPDPFEEGKRNPSKITFITTTTTTTYSSKLYQSLAFFLGN